MLLQLARENLGGVPAGGIEVAQVEDDDRPPLGDDLCGGQLMTLELAGARHPLTSA
jgi:hypothetical protein